VELPTARLALLTLIVTVVALAAVPAAAQTTGQTTGQGTGPVYDSEGNLVETPFVPPEEDAEPQLTEAKAVALALRFPKIADWVERYPANTLTDDATFDKEDGLWEVNVSSSLPDAGQIAEARVEDSTGRVTEAWTGPQVAWSMARGGKGAFGRKINEPWIWLTFCGVFLLGLADFRRPFSIRNLDLLVLLSFSISLFYFNRGEVFTAMPLAYPPLAYLLARMAWIGRHGRGSDSRPLWPAWVLLAATVFLVGFRVGLNAAQDLKASNVIDVGLAGVQGAQRIVAEGEAPYGNMPTDDGKKCGLPDSNGYVRERIQTNGRCESANERGDTYGPVSYLAYVPGYVVMGWNGKWDTLPAAHFTSILWDLLALAGIGLLGLRLGGKALGATLAFAWAAYPFTQYVSSSNSNDTIMPALLIWGLVFATSPTGRGLFVGLAAWTKFAALLLVPLWASHPSGWRLPRQKAAYAGGFLLATALGFWILLLEPDPVHAARVFWDRTFGWQLSRPSPFSIWDWDEYPGYPDLSLVQTVLKVALLVAAVALYFVPREKNIIQLAALSGALMIGFELVLTHWFYLYIPWFFPFVALAALAPLAPRTSVEAPAHERPVRELVPAS
jgi:hypothetical protein